MQTDMFHDKRPSVIARRTGAWLPVLASLPLCFAAVSCLDSPDEDAETATVSQPVQAGCSIRRPYGWDGPAAFCVESQRNTQTLFLRPGERFEFDSVPIVGLGSGFVVVTCHANGDGLWDENPKVCIPRIGGPSDPL